MKRKVSKKTAALILSVSLLLGATLGGTLAWLTDKTEEVTNTFTVSNVGLELTETTEGYKMIPGLTIAKDPLVTVTAGSEDCWVFLKVMETENLDSFIEYKIDSNNWTPLTGENGDVVDDVYYIKVTDITSARNIKVLAGGEYTVDATNVTYTWEANQVLTKPEVIETMMDEITPETEPKLTFTAYASQLYRSNDVEFKPIEAWNLVKDLSDTSSI